MIDGLRLAFRDRRTTLFFWPTSGARARGGHALSSTILQWISEGKLRIGTRKNEPFVWTLDGPEIAIKIPLDLPQWILIITGNTLGKQIAVLFSTLSVGILGHWIHLAQWPHFIFFWLLVTSQIWGTSIFLGSGKAAIETTLRLLVFFWQFCPVCFVTSRGGSCNYSFGAGMCKLSCCFKKIETMWDFSCCR